MTIGRICCREVDTANPEESIRAAAQRMGARAVGTLVVLDAGNHPVGILTDRDLTVRAVGAGADPNTTLVGHVMSECVHTAFEEKAIEDALGLMRAQAIRRLVVVRRDGTLAGILSLDDVLRLLAEEFQSIGELLDQEDPRRIAAAG